MPVREIEIHHLVEQNRDIRAIGEDGANRLGDFGGRKAGSGDLIEQRLEQVMIGPVHQRHAGLWMAEMLAESQAAKACPENHDLRVPIFRHAPVFIKTAEDANSGTGLRERSPDISSAL